MIEQEEMSEIGTVDGEKLPEYGEKGDKREEKVRGNVARWRAA